MIKIVPWYLFSRVIAGISNSITTIPCHRNCFRYKSNKSQFFVRSVTLEPRVSGDLRVTLVGGAVAVLKAMILAAVILSVERWWEAAPVHRLSAADTRRDPF